MESVVAYFQELSRYLPEGMKYSVKSVGVLVNIRGVPAFSDIHPLPRHYKHHHEYLPFTSAT